MHQNLRYTYIEILTYTYAHTKPKITDLYQFPLHAIVTWRCITMVYRFTVITVPIVL